MALIKRDLEIDNWRDLSLSLSLSLSLPRLERELLTGSSVPLPSAQRCALRGTAAWLRRLNRIKFTSLLLRWRKLAPSGRQGASRVSKLTSLDIDRDYTADS